MLMRQYGWCVGRTSTIYLRVPSVSPISSIYVSHRYDDGAVERGVKRLHIVELNDGVPFRTEWKDQKPVRKLRYAGAGTGNVACPMEWIRFCCNVETRSSSPAERDRQYEEFIELCKLRNIDISGSSMAVAKSNTSADLAASTEKTSNNVEARRYTNARQTRNKTRRKGVSC